MLVLKCALPVAGCQSVRFQSGSKHQLINKIRMHIKEDGKSDQKMYFYLFICECMLCIIA